jgi:DNA-binding CsgD family transcriptional regulator
MIRFFLALMILFIIAGIMGSCQDKPGRDLGKDKIQRYIEELDSIHIMLLKREFSLPPDSFFTVYSRIRTLYELIPDTSHKKIASYYKICDELYNNGGYHEAIQQGLHGIAISEHPLMRNNGENNRQFLYGLLAGCYIRIGQMDSALNMYRTARERSHLIADTIVQASAVNNLGVFFYSENQIDSARRYFIIADSLLHLDGLHESRKRNFHASVKNNLASLYELDGDYEKARIFYEENYKMYRKRKNTPQMISSGISLANAMLETGIEKQAVLLLNEMNGLLDTTRFENKTEQLIRLSSVYQKYYEQKGQYEKAQDYADREILLSDSLRTLEYQKMSKTMADLADINSAQFSNKIAMEKQARDALQRVSRLRFWVIFAIMFSGLGALTTLLVLYRQRSLLLKKNAIILEDKRFLAEKQLKAESHEKKLAELEVANKQKDLVQLALHLTQKQEWARYLNTLFERVENSKGYQRKKELNILKSEIRSQIHADREIQVLQQDIASLSTSFYDKLLKEFPGLSKTEIRMCSYIRLDLSTDQIAQLHNIAPGSVKIRRYRLKKKLNLSSDQDLDAFLRNF